MPLSVAAVSTHLLVHTSDDVRRLLTSVVSNFETSVFATENLHLFTQRNLAEICIIICCECQQADYLSNHRQRFCASMISSFQHELLVYISYSKIVSVYFKIITLDVRINLYIIWIRSISLIFSLCFKIKDL